MTSDMERMGEKGKEWKSERKGMEKEIERLRGELEERCEKIENQMPYINTVISEKNALQVELTRVSNDLKKK